MPYRLFNTPITFNETRVLRLISIKIPTLTLHLECGTALGGFFPGLSVPLGVKLKSASLCSRWAFDGKTRMNSEH